MAPLVDIAQPTDKIARSEKANMLGQLEAKLTHIASLSD